MDDEENIIRNVPMGEGRNPYKELIGWGNQTAWGELLPSDIGLDIPQSEWKKNPRDHVIDKPLIEIGETSNKQIPVFLSNADNTPDQTDGALYVYSNNRNKTQQEEKDDTD